MPDTRDFSSQENRSYFEMFQDESKTFTSLSLFLSSKKEATGDPDFDEYYWRRTIASLEGNLRTIHKYSQSPLETAFLTAIQVNFIMYGYPLHLRINGGWGDDVRDHIQHETSYCEGIFQSYLFYRNLPVDARPSSYEKFILQWSRDETSGITPQVAKDCAHIALFDFDLGRYHSVCITLQPKFNQLYNGKSIRPDALLWVASNPQVKTILECDGFEFHGPKEVFIEDRKRDRALQAAGFRVERFSGSEIYSNLVDSTRQYCERLIKADAFGYKYAVKWRRAFERKHKSKITPSLAVAESWRRFMLESNDA